MDVRHTKTHSVDVHMQGLASWRRLTKTAAVGGIQNTLFALPLVGPSRFAAYLL